MTKKRDLAQRLRQWMELRFSSVNDFAAALNISQPMASQYLTGVRTPGNIMQDRLRALGCNIEWLMTGKSNDDFVPAEIELTSIPVYDILSFHAARGKSMVKENAVEYLHVERKNDSTRYGIIMRGNAMHGVFDDGDIIIASEIAPVSDGDNCIVTLSTNQKLLRRVYKHGNTYTLTAANDLKFPPQIVPAKNVVSIHRIVEKITRY